jgi:hypothetical protein
MVHPRRRRSAAWSVVGFWVFWGMMLGQPCGESRAAPSLSNLAPPLPFRLTVHKGVLSLHAQDASLKEIIEEIGRRLRIETVVKIPPDQQVTLMFEQLSLEEAIKRFRKYAHIVYHARRDSDTASGQITKILVFPKSAGTTGLDAPTGEEDVRAGESPLTPQRRTRQEPIYQEVPRPQPFKFEFDPSQAVEERK